MGCACVDGVGLLLARDPENVSNICAARGHIHREGGPGNTFAHDPVCVSDYTCIQLFDLVTRVMTEGHGCTPEALAAFMRDNGYTSDSIYGDRWVRH